MPKSSSHPDVSTLAYTEKDRGRLGTRLPKSMYSCTLLLCAMLFSSILHRNVCQQQFPQSLPKLLQSVNWNNRTEVAQVTL